MKKKMLTLFPDLFQTKEKASLQLVPVGCALYDYSPLFSFSSPLLLRRRLEVGFRCEKSVVIEGIIYLVGDDEVCPGEEESIC